MKSIINIEITTNMIEGRSAIPEEYELDPDSCPEDEMLSPEDIEKSIHESIPRVINTDRVKKAICDIINEGGWIIDLEGYIFPDEYCDFEIKATSLKKKKR
ncbi:hypothetical protein GF312_13760 [Candidatus Poribacteria bacterium]|nr:hypothetical protein [Candidatus Poribacteria bacterium]